MKTALAAIASALLFASATLPAQVQAQQQAATPLASADPAVIAATKRMLEVMKVRATMASVVQTVEQQMSGQFRAAMLDSVNRNAALTPQQKADQIKRMDDEIPKQTARLHAIFADPTLADDMVAELVPLYAETYTLDEIRQMTAFYASPVGQKMQASAPTLLARSFEISQRVMMPRIQKAMAQPAPAAGQ